MTDDELEQMERWYAALDEPNETVLALMAEVRALREERDRHVAALAECYRLTGADPDGNADRHLAPYAVSEVGRLRDELDEVDEANVALRDGIRTKCEWWDREHPAGQAFEVTSDFRDLLDGKAALTRTVGGYPSSGRPASDLKPPPSGPAPGGKR